MNGQQAWEKMPNIFAWREMHIKTVMRYHYTATKMVHYWYNCKMIQPLWNITCQFFTMWNISSPCNVVIPFLVFTTGNETYIPTKTRLQKFVTALFVIARNWNQRKFSSTGEELRKLWFIHKTEEYSTIKKNKLQMQTKTWVNLKNMMVSERTQTGETTKAELPGLAWGAGTDCKELGNLERRGNYSAAWLLCWWHDPRSGWNPSNCIL